ncbi:MAG: hypothetical protein ACYC6A_05580 [Armatimonadota bacterium]
MPIFRILRSTVSWLLLFLCCAVPATAESLRLPTFFIGDDVLMVMLRDAGGSTEFRAAATASGESNVGPLESLTDEGQPARDFTGTEGKADLHMGGALMLRAGDWLVCYGEGMRDGYTGNHDAAQLWIDQHAGAQTQPRYAPVVNTDRVEASWYGLGRRFRVHGGTVSGYGDVIVRALAADDFQQRALVGEVEGDAFSGMLKIRSAASKAEGKGWSVDSRLFLTLDSRWRALVTAEGLLGEVAWKDLRVKDIYLVSPGVFTDVDGFLHQFGGASGTAWREDLTLQLEPLYRVELLAATQPAFLCGASYQQGEMIKPMLGLAWLRNAQALYLRLHPMEKQIEIGAAGDGWQLRVASDDWLRGDSSNLSATLAGTLTW